MKKEAKIVFIIWVVWLFLSITYLVFMNKWPAVDENIKNEILNQDTWWLDDLSTSWLNLSWGLRVDSWEFLTSWLVDLKTSWLKLTNEIVVMIPEFLCNEWFGQLAKKIYENTWIVVKYKKIANISEYKKILSSGNAYTWKVDIYLLPSDRLQSFSWKKINLWENIKPYFHYIFADYIDKETSFIPYSIDPLVTFLNKNSNYQESSIDFKSLFSYIISRKKSKSLSIPFLFGAGENDFKLLEKNQESFSDYFTFWYNLMYQFKKWNSLAWLQTFLDTINFNSDYKRDLLEFKKLNITISKRNPNCKIYSSMCAFSYRFVDIAFGFLSDQNIIKDFTGWGIWLDNVLIYNFPISSDIYKVRGRWFVANSDSKNNSQINYFLKMYIKSSVLNSLPLRENSLSAFNNIFQIQKIQQRYQNILSYEQKFSLMYSDINLQENFIKKTNLINLLNGGYKSDLFLNNLSWEF